MTTPAVYQSVEYGNASSGGDVTINKPSGVVSGDLMVVTITAAASVTWTVLSGWTRCPGTPNVLGGDIFYKVAGGSEGSSYTFHCNNALTALRGAVTRWTGFDTTTPIQTSAGGAVTTNGLSPTVTASVANSVLYCSLVNVASNNTSCTVPSGMTQAFNTTTTAFKLGATETVGSGATGTRQWTNPNTTCYATSVIINPGPSAVTGDASQTATGTVTATGALGRVGAASQTANATVTATGAIGAVAGASLTATAATTAIGILGAISGASLTGVGATTVDGTIGFGGSATLIGVGTVSTDGTRGAIGAVSLTGTGTTTAAGVRGVSGDDSLTGTATVTTGGLMGYAAGASITAVATVEADGTITGNETGDAILTALVDVSTDGSLGAIADATLTAIVNALVVGSRGQTSDSGGSTASVAVDASGSVGTTSGAELEALVEVECSGTVTGNIPDWPVVNPTRQIAGTVIHHETGADVPGATIRMFRDFDGHFCQETTSGAGGDYVILRDEDDPYTYFVAAQYEDGGVQVHGVSDRGLIPTTI